jgi:hypothetical protein
MNSEGMLLCWGSRATRVASRNQGNEERAISSVGDCQMELGITHYGSRSSKSGNKREVASQDF